MHRIPLPPPRPPLQPRTSPTEVNIYTNALMRYATSRGSEAEEYDYDSFMVGQRIYTIVFRNPKATRLNLELDPPGPYEMIVNIDHYHHEYVESWHERLDYEDYTPEEQYSLNATVRLNDCYEEPQPMFAVETNAILPKTHRSIVDAIDWIIKLP